jgi:hypothetical protein
MQAFEETWNINVALRNLCDGVSSGFEEGDGNSY